MLFVATDVIYENTSMIWMYAFVMVPSQKFGMVVILGWQTWSRVPSHSPKSAISS